MPLRTPATKWRGTEICSVRPPRCVTLRYTAGCSAPLAHRQDAFPQRTARSTRLPRSTSSSGGSLSNSRLRRAIRRLNLTAV